MDNNINNFNYFKQELQSKITQFIKEQNIREDGTQYNKYKLLQFGRDLFKIFISDNQFVFERYSLEPQSTLCAEAGSITLIDAQKKQRKFDFQQFLQFDFDIKIKQGIICLELKSQKKIIYVFMGPICFSCMPLYQLIDKLENKKISFNNPIKQQPLFFEQIEQHSTIPGLVVLLANKLDEQLFCLYYFRRDGIVCLFQKKTMEFIHNQAKNFTLDNECNVFFVDVFGSLFQIDFSDILTPLKKDLKIQEQSYIGKKSEIINIEKFNLHVFSLKQMCKFSGQLVYFEKMPIDEENMFIFFSQDGECLEISISKIEKSKADWIFQQKINRFVKKIYKLSWDLNDKSFYEITVTPILKYKSNQPKIDTLFYFCMDFLISVDISSQFSVQTYNLEDFDEKQDKISTIEIADAYPIDFCYAQSLILQIKKENSHQLIEVNYELLELQQQVNDIYVQKLNQNYQEQKQTLKNIRVFLSNGIFQIYLEKQKIVEESSLEKLTNCEGKIYTQVQRDLNPIVKHIQKEFKAQKLPNNSKVLKLYQQCNEIFSILNSHDYQENEKKVILSSYKLEEVLKEHKIQQEKYEQIQKQLQECKKTDETRLRQLLINSILEKGEKFSKM